MESSNKKIADKMIDEQKLNPKLQAKRAQMDEILPGTDAIMGDLTDRPGEESGAIEVAKDGSRMSEGSWVSSDDDANMEAWEPPTQRGGKWTHASDEAE